MSIIPVCPSTDFTTRQCRRPSSEARSTRLIVPLSLSLSRKEHKHCINQIETTKLHSLGEQAKTLIWPNLDDMHVIVYCGAERNRGTTLHHLKNKSVLSI